jgi:hypothetical protein
LRIGRADELVRYLGRGAECGIVEDGKIFLDRATGRPARVRGQTRGTFDAGAIAGVSLDQTGIDGKAFTADIERSRCSAGTCLSSENS